METKELFLVYNADSSIFAAATDFVKKLATPDKYDCQLCMVTYGAVKMKHPWKEYLDSLPYKKTFLHRDEFKKKYPGSGVALPAILMKNTVADELEIILSAEDINNTKNLQALIAKMHSKLAQ